jgi:hypothetical protein
MIIPIKRTATPARAPPSIAVEEEEWEEADGKRVGDDVTVGDEDKEVEDAVDEPSLTLCAFI